MRRFNYTGRRTLKQSSIDLVLLGTKGGALEIQAEIDLTSYGAWPPDAQLVLEAIDGGAFERIEVGAVGDGRLSFKRPLTVFHGDQTPRFRIKVISASSDQGKLLALSTVRPRRQDEGPNHSMLHVTVGPLGSEIFRLELVPGSHPVLIVNDRLPANSEYAGKELVRHTVFMSLVFPQLLRSILSDILLIQDVDDDIDNDRPEGMWLNFARALNADEIPDNDDSFARTQWIDEAVSAFAKRNDLLSKFVLWGTR